MNQQWGETIISLWKKKNYWQNSQLCQRHTEQPFLYRPILVHSEMPHWQLAAAWIVFANTNMKEFAGGTWKSGVFEYTVWLLEHDADAPRLLWRELVEKTRCLTRSPAMQELACDIDKVSIDRDVVWVRDRRVLPSPAAQMYPHQWRSFPRRAV